MNKIEVAAALIENAAAELKQIEEYAGERRLCYSPYPKQRLRDDLKMIRRITLDIEKELELNYEQ